VCRASISGCIPVGLGKKSSETVDAETSSSPFYGERQVDLSCASCAANGLAAQEDCYDPDLTKRHLSFILYELSFR